jgi:uncharacterized membrane protein
MKLPAATPLPPAPSALRNILSTFMAGTLAALPLVATIAILVWTVRFLNAYVGPESAVGRGLTALGLGTGSEVAGYLIGLGIVMVGVFLLGVFVRTRFSNIVAEFLEGIVQRIPVIRTIYDFAKSLVDLLGQRDSEKLKSMSPVWLYFGGEGGAAVLGLLSTSEPVVLAGKPYVGVLVPSAPVPVGGGLIYVPADWVKPAHMGVEGLTSIYVSMGITSQQHIGTEPKPQEKDGRPDPMS